MALCRRDLEHKKVSGGGRRIRTYGGSPLNGFQDRRFRPLSQPTKKSRQRASGGEGALYRCARFNQATFQLPPPWGRGDRCWREEYSATPR
jgi:hypothetical protein